MVILQNYKKRMRSCFEFKNGTEQDLADRCFIEHLYKNVMRNDYDNIHLYRWELGKDVIDCLTSNSKIDKSTPSTLFGIRVIVNNHSPRVIHLWRLMNYEE